MKIRHSRLRTFLLSAISAISAISISAHAAGECEEFRVDGPGGSLEKVALRDQESNGTCYAASIAQFYDALRFYSGDTDAKFQTSTLYVANIYREMKFSATKREDESFTPHTIDFGLWPDYVTVLLHLADAGSCSDDQIKKKLVEKPADPSALKKLTEFFFSRFFHVRKKEGTVSDLGVVDSESSKAYTRFLRTVERTKKEIIGRNALREYDLQEQKKPHLDNFPKLYSDRRILIGKAVTEHADGLAPMDSGPAYVGSLSKNLRKEFAGKNGMSSQPSPVFHYLDSVSRQHPEALFADFSQFLQLSEVLSCPRSERKVSDSVWPLVGNIAENPDETGLHGGKERLAEPLAWAFRANKNKLPVLASVNCFPFQKMSRARIREIAEGKSEMKDDECDGGHAFIVIGRRWNPSSARCEYLIRNSWGKGDYYHSDWYVEPEKGIFGVDADMLERMSNHVITVNLSGRKPASIEADKKPYRPFPWPKR